jgi:hypothetical protein
MLANGGDGLRGYRGPGVSVVLLWHCRLEKLSCAGLTRYLLSMERKKRNRNSPTGRSQRVSQLRFIPRRYAQPKSNQVTPMHIQRLKLILKLRSFVMITLQAQRSDAVWQFRKREGNRYPRRTRTREVSTKHHYTWAVGIRYLRDKRNKELEHLIRSKTQTRRLNVSTPRSGLS